MVERVAERTESMVREYKYPRQYAKDCQKLAKEGWVVQNVSERWQRHLLLPSKQQTLVTYTRTTLNKGYARCAACGEVNQYGKGHSHCTTCGTILTKP